ncbi:hypothetical protein evm_015052 [Chilo suppressalis]|nr:hypothetical protein evm_015052 [Chilo suppressalis]
MAVSRPAGAGTASGLDTPASEPGLPLTDLWDDDWGDTDPEEMLMYRHQRRLSDPSANINNFVRGGWRTKDPKDKSRSENEGLDSLVNGLAEIEAGDLRSDERRGSRASSGVARMRTICPRGSTVASGCDADDVSSPRCLHVVSPRRCRPAAAAARLPLRPPPPAPGDCEVAADAAQWEETADANAECTEDGGFKAKAEAGCGKSARAFCTLPRAGGAAAALYNGARLPPRRATPDGTHIFYWCDLPPARRPGNIRRRCYHCSYDTAGFMTLDVLHTASRGRGNRGLI